MGKQIPHAGQSNIKSLELCLPCLGERHVHIFTFSSNMLLIIKLPSIVTSKSILFGYTLIYYLLDCRRENIYIFFNINIRNLISLLIASVPTFRDVCS